MPVFPGKQVGEDRKGEGCLLGPFITIVGLRLVTGAEPCANSANCRDCVGFRVAAGPSPRKLAD